MSAIFLAQLADIHGTDKNRAHRYTQHYAAHFDGLRDRQFTMLEIGVGGYDNPFDGGQSLRMWKDYFPHARIIGLDWYEKSLGEEDRIKIYRGSQADPVTMSQIIVDNGGPFEIIIDDGSHRSEHVIATLIMMWQYVSQGGWYVIEDLQTAYWPHYGGRLHDPNSPQTSLGFIKTLIDCLNWEEIHQPTYSPNEFDKSLVGIHFYHNLVFLKKGQNMESSNYVVSNRLPNV